MIAVLAIFGTLIAIGTIADGILNIMKLDIVPERFLRVKTFYRIYSYPDPSGFPRLLSLQ